MPYPSDDIVEADEVIREANSVRDDIEDLIAEKDDLEEEQLELDEEAEDYDEQYSELETQKDDLDIQIEDLKNENLELIEFADEVVAGTTLINDDFFVKYAEQMADEFGVDPATWPGNCIDWEAAADQLKADYSVLEWDGYTFYYQ
jgi:predicted nuclease with TOPRIM domain